VGFQSARQNPNSGRVATLVLGMSWNLSEEDEKFQGQTSVRNEL
jgi:hypothetical protein